MAVLLRPAPAPKAPIIFVKPKAGLKIPYPGTRNFLPATGASVPRNHYWIRRLRDGDVIQVEAASPAKVEPTETPAPPEPATH